MSCILKLNSAYFLDENIRIVLLRAYSIGVFLRNVEFLYLGKARKEVGVQWVYPHTTTTRALKVRSSWKTDTDKDKSKIAFPIF